VPVNTEVILTGGPDYDIFTVGFAADTRTTRGPVTINSPQDDVDFAYFYDYFNPNSQTYTLQTNPLDSTGILVDRAGTTTLAYNGLTQLIVFSPLVGGNAINVRSNPANLFLNIVASDGDAVWLGSTACDCVDSPIGGTLSEIHGPANIASYGVEDDVTLTLDDSGNNTIARYVSISPYDVAGPWGQVAGLLGSSLLFRDYANWSVEVRGGSLNDRYLMSGNPLTADVSIDGGAGNDVIVGSGGNVLTGGIGRDLLVAGALPSTLDGGSGEDIVIGGKLNDTSKANLDLIMSIWGDSGSSYAIRVTSLRANLLADDKITGNGNTNILTGGIDALDLFFGSTVTDLQEGESAL
jgi:Ca2+-binding RTX toxin-like protein